ncbi:hypothetical protein [Streptomyces phaeochromogenes]|uniref:hypothetical protein n=1 Tax=Streptomyces phaeochromogenes TaxID=1923 RepID=UPI002DDC69C5|nr:hypothetical protein [Streptomyces phaeochromogenes]WRZ26268.1 hypothetical protein OG931_00135 [Streptomyces phaeochromogenes]
MDEEYRRAPVLTAARWSSLSDAVDLLWEVTEPHLRGEDVAQSAALAARAASYAIQEPRPGWLDRVSDDQQFLTALATELPAEPSRAAQRSGLETFGTGTGHPLALARYREGVSRLAGALPRAGSTMLLSRARRPVHLNVAQFLGDVLVYVQQQSWPGELGPIAQRVVEAVEVGDRRRTADDPHLVVVAHSLGGSICLDLLTRPGPALRCEVNTFVTVGSQVGLLAELGLFPHVPRPSATEPQPVRAPDGVRRWLNIYDANDSLSFLAAPVFEGAEDLRYSTGRGLLHAHSSYLSRPSFFLRLADHLGERQT